MALFKRLRTWIHARQLGRQSTELYYVLAEACLIGLVSALTALFLERGIGILGSLRLRLVQDYGVIILPIFGLSLGLFAGWFVEFFSPAAAGSGIPQVKAVLAQFPIPLSLRVVVVKLIGTIFALASGLALGRRGPTVHIGAALAAQLSHWFPTSPQHRHQIIAAGAAAGLAAGFNTPIAGVLFVVEELSRDMSSVTLEIAILASFTGSIVSRLWGSADLNLTQEFFEHSAETLFNPQEIPFYLLLGILAGLLGNSFKYSILKSLEFYRNLNVPMFARVGLAGLVSGSIVAFAPPILLDNAGIRDFFLTGDVGWQEGTLAFVLYFVLTLIAYGSGAPGGLFSPTLVLGAALGYLVGNGAALFSSSAEPSTFALVGMAAFFSAVARVPVTAIVIVFEMTTAFNLVLPLMIGSVVAYFIASTFSQGSLYQRLLEASGIQLSEEATPHDLLSNLTAADVMQRQVDTLVADITLDRALQLFSEMHHEGFPVVEGRKLVGMITVAQTNLAKRRGQSGEATVREIMTPRPIAVDDRATLGNVLYLMERYHLSHLPVTEGSRLIGIITRSDIIRAEANQLSQSISQADAQPAPSYLVYQTRDPSVGRGRILLPLANPETAPALVQMAAAIAKEQQYELECLCIILVPKHSPPAQTAVRTGRSRRLLRKAQRLVKQWQIPVHCQIRVAHHASQAILETIDERHIDLLLMGWKGITSTPGRIFGSTVDSTIQKAPCDVVLVKLGEGEFAYPNDYHTPSNWIVPIAGGPNVRRAIQLLPAFKLLTRSPKILMCKVFSPDITTPDTVDLEKVTELMEKRLKIRAIALPIRSESVADAIVHLAKTKKCDAILLGASREGLLQQAVRGNIPEAIANGVNCTVILVRSTLD
ncbi:chloride channel protein [Lusitaniella coriacea LEGE 07157]|uniref:Chloride channel protein n=1 Tax=Lusitaniella coriacea LEGE 07157 TaxID=945747 RepID=A0A8J7DX94_9CYAN|nr:chloride channel protein [Lusitaniella coriacea]MBE9116832.1 chloride channel protein [Lusitaniella coriacea LEGE 07157]